MKLALLDKDGTLVSSYPHKFTTKPDQQMIIPSALPALKRLREAGYALVVVSNQGGVGMGYKSLQDAMEEMLFCNSLFCDALGSKCVFESFYFCPDIEGRECWHGEPWDDRSWKNPPRDCGQSMMAFSLGLKYRFRKPSPGMLIMAKHYQTICSNYDGEPHYQLEDVVMIGDRPEDQEAAESANIRFLWAEDWREGAV